MQIVVLDEESGQRIKLEVDARHTIGSIVEVITDELKLLRTERYSLALDGRALESGSTIGQDRIREGSSLTLKALTAAASTAPRQPPLPRQQNVAVDLGAPVCRVCGKPLALLDEQHQRWYCFKDNELYYAKTNQWAENKPVQPPPTRILERSAEGERWREGRERAGVPRRCANCGTPLQELAEFCIECGAKVTAAVPASRKPFPEQPPAKTGLAPGASKRGVSAFTYSAIAAYLIAFYSVVSGFASLMTWSASSAYMFLPLMLLTFICMGGGLFLAGRRLQARSRIGRKLALILAAISAVTLFILTANLAVGAASGLGILLSVPNFALGVLVAAMWGRLAEVKAGKAKLGVRLLIAADDLSYAIGASAWGVIVAVAVTGSNFYSTAPTALVAILFAYAVFPVAALVARARRGIGAAMQILFGVVTVTMFAAAFGPTMPSVTAFNIVLLLLLTLLFGAPAITIAILGIAGLHRTRTSGKQ